MKTLGSSSLRRRLWARARGRAREPVFAGLGRPGADGVCCWVELPNVAPRPDAFDVPAEGLLRLAEGRFEVRAWLHVHPRGPGEMSPRDEAAAVLGGGPAWPGVEWVVLGPDGSGTRNRPTESGLRTRRFRDFCASDGS